MMRCCRYLYHLKSIEVWAVFKVYEPTQHLKNVDSLQCRHLCPSRLGIRALCSSETPPRPRPRPFHQLMAELEAAGLGPNDVPHLKVGARREPIAFLAVCHAISRACKAKIVLAGWLAGWWLVAKSLADISEIVA